MIVNPDEVSLGKLHNHMLSSIGPRPIAFASTIDKAGNRNLSPFSYFNVFSTRPPIAIFSPAKSGRTNTQKNTYENAKETMEVVINVVTHSIVQQMSLSSTAYEKGVDEFVKSGLTPIESDLVKPFRVKESPINLECKVREIVELGDEGGSGNLIICEILRIHIDDNVLDEDGSIDQRRIDLVGRMGGDYYVRANGEALFTVPKPVRNLGIGVDQIPNNIKEEKAFSGNDLGMLGNIEEIPSEENINAFATEENVGNSWEEKVTIAKRHLNQQDIDSAWKVLLSK